MLYDVFICHASEDKEAFVRPLADALINRHVEVWYDEFALSLGDSIRRAIDRGLAQSRFGVVVLSPDFFAKNWPQYELDGLLGKEMAGKDKVILPVWHNVTHDVVALYSPALAERYAARSSCGLSSVADEILKVVRPQGSPLIIARDFLIQHGIEPPVITDQYWLEVVEASNRVPGFGAAIPETSSWERWSFPLPPKDEGPDAWGQRLAWTAMQLKWVEAAEAIPITPMTHPTRVLKFISGNTGLFAMCQAYPTLAAEYAPQLTIPTFGGALELTFEKEYQSSLRNGRAARRRHSTYGSGITTSGLSPLCDEEWALRDPKFGEYQASIIAESYFGGGMFGPRVSPFEEADHLFWLLSQASAWLPEKVREMLTQGMREWWAWPWHEGSWKEGGAFAKQLFAVSEKKQKFAWAKPANSDCLSRIRLAVRRLGLPEGPEELLERFKSGGFVETLLRVRRARLRKHKKSRRA